MKRGHLSEYFAGVAVKRLRAVETSVDRSNQHEFNGVASLKRLFGPAHGNIRFPAKFIYLSDSDDNPLTSDGFLTWYDARENIPTRSEHRLYFPSNPAIDRSTEGDLLVLARKPDNSVLVVVAEKDTTISNQVEWLFGVNDLTQEGYFVRDNLETERDRIALTSRLILESIGIEVGAPPDSHLEDMLRMFSGVFPPTRAFSAYARSTMPDADSRIAPDSTLMAWMEREESLFRTLERHLIVNRLSKGFGDDVEDFISFSLSVQNRRKSRVGLALENHLEEVFTSSGVRHARAATTENNSKPDFLFPGAAEYRDKSFDTSLLTMLGVKSTCKDRWRQVLSEADRVTTKHLLTMEPAISVNQTDEMRSKNLQLVLPQSLHSTFRPAQQEWLLNVEELVALLRNRQNRT